MVVVFAGWLAEWDLWVADTVVDGGPVRAPLRTEEERAKSVDGIGCC